MVTILGRPPQMAKCRLEPTLLRAAVFAAAPAGAVTSL